MWFYLVFLIYAAFETGRLYVEPQTLFDLGLRYEAPVYCRKLTEAELAKKNIRLKGVMASYVDKQEEECDRNLFISQERDSSIDFIAENLEQCSERVLQSLKNNFPNQELQKRPIYIQVVDHYDAENAKVNPDAQNEGTNRPLDDLVRDVFIGSLTQGMGAGSVIRWNDQEKDIYILQVRIKPVLDPDYLCAVRMAKINQGIQVSSWQTF